MRAAEKDCILRAMLNLAVTAYPNTSSKELDLITAAQRGDLSAFNQLVRAHQELAYRFAFHVSENAPAAERATKNAFESAYRHIRRWKGEPFRVWLLRLVLRECKRMRIRTHAANVLAPTPLEIGLAILNWDERVICVLADVLGLTDDEISDITDAPENHIRAKRSRARKQIRDVLQLQRTMPQEWNALHLA